MSNIIGTLSGVLGSLSVPAGVIGSHSADDLGAGENPSGNGGGGQSGYEDFDAESREHTDEGDDTYDDWDEEDEQDWDAIERRQRRTIYAEETTRDLWAFELREIRFEGFH
jgi:hypothetical protein